MRNEIKMINKIYPESSTKTYRTIELSNYLKMS